MALIIFVDDSKCSIAAQDGSERKWFGYGGFAIEDRFLPELDKKFESLKEIYGFPSRLPKNARIRSIDVYREAKYNPSSNQWMHKNLTDERRRDFFLEVISLVGELSGEFIFSYYDESCDGCGDTRAKSRALENLYERINASAIDHNSSVGIVVCDIEGSNDQVQRLIEKATGIARLGSWYQRNIRTNLYPVMLTADSNAHAGLQIADIAMGVLSKMIIDERKYAPPIWNAVIPRLYTRANIARGWGIKIRCNDYRQIYTRLNVMG